MNPLILIDAGPKNDLKWPTLESEIEMTLKEFDSLSFAFDFGFDPDHFNFKDEITFFSLSIAVGEFIKRVSEPFGDKVKEILFYRGRGDFSRSILQKQYLYHAFVEWKEEYFSDKALHPHMLRLFSIQMMMQYLHQLAAPIPDGPKLIVQLEGLDDMRPSEALELSSDEHFSYIHLDQNVDEEATIAIVLPQIGKVDYTSMDKIILFFKAQGIRYRVIPEKLLTEKWCGIDELVVISHTISQEGLRMLQGFNAAMGSVIWMGEEMDGIEGTSFEKRFGAEGFEPPTFWSQTRRASQAALCSE